jgi:hypothetical protein
MRTAINPIVSASIAAALGMLCSIGVAGESDTQEGANLLAFIGHKISIEQVETPHCADCIVMDVHFVATYEIERMVFGDYRDRAITFDVYDHDGTPPFSQYDKVLLFVSRQPDGGAIHAKPVRFRHPVSYPLDGLPRAQVKRNYPAGYFEIRDGRAYCLRGTPVPELFQAKKETVLTARGIFNQKSPG